MPGGWEWAVLVLIALLLVGGSRLSGIGRSTGKAVRGFAEEVSALRGSQQDQSEVADPVETKPTPDQAVPRVEDVVDAELVEAVEDDSATPGQA